ncbi:hypothetical protein SNE25_27060 [Mucilaginibacter sabulilitoris]|uniref:DUF4412 domain-containing protein n=1 Tax=Mucilaginibacter sabulilitoris TaxID=1173583 RepID=A0ABZ0TLE4_9SPHI|nr:hypothetical protein [Mucilaginibacter sabulilitoris]WPU92988.1 hypothetical protein SNE25_27060 [Mucilaginibacter sabulilitoris]
MKKSLFTLLFVLISLFTFAQSFEGKIIYQLTYKSKMPSVTDAQFSSMMGNTQNYYIKGGDYKSETNGSFILSQLYINKDNKLYNKFSNSGALLWNDGAVNPDSVISSALNKGVIVNLGHKCDELVLTCKSGLQKYYFTSKLPADSKLYVNHRFGNWYAFLSKANAIPLKMTIDNANFYMEAIATDIKPMKLDAALFTLPAGVETKKSPY